jgi:hypothetical protein
MYTVIKDNRQLLRYRGLLTPNQTILDAQNTAVRLALLDLVRLNSNRSGLFSSGSDTDVNKLTITNPFMRLLPEDGGSSNNEVYDFYFPYTPQSIDYSDMSDEIAEIERVGTTPIVTFKSHKLMRVSMEFLVAVPYDGLIIDVEESLNILRIFATQSQRSVRFYHLDEMLTRGWSYRKGPGPGFSNSYFNIADLTVTARQRNSYGKITQAVVRMTFVENQNPQIVVTRVPPFRKKKKKKPPKPPTTKTKPQKVTAITETEFAEAIAQAGNRGLFSR